MICLKQYLEKKAEQKYLSSLPCASKMTKVVLDPVLGRNVLAAKNISAGTLLGVYPGLKLTVKEYLEKHEFLKMAARNCFALENDRIIDPSDIFGYLPDTNELRLAFINEASSSDQINVISLTSSENIWYLLIQDVSAEDPLYIYYGKSYKRNYSTNIDYNKLIVDIDLLRDTAKRCKWLRKDIERIFTSS